MKDYGNYKRKGFWMKLDACKMLHKLSRDYRWNQTVTVEELIRKAYNNKFKDENNEN